MEVVVAIAILSIAIIPIMFTFVHSVRNNAEASQRQRAISAAQTIMENFKALPVATIDEQFANGTFQVGTGTVYATTETFPDRVVYTIPGIEYMGSAYNATVTLGKPAGSPAEEVITTEFTDMNPYSDAVYQSEFGIDPLADSLMKSAVLALWNEKESTPGVSSVTHDEAEIDERKIEITKHTFNIEAVVAADGSEEVYMTDIYEYKIENFPYTDPVTGTQMFLNNIFDPVSSDPQLIYTNRNTRGNGASLKKIFLYFYPGYRGTWTGRNPWIIEEIVVKNDTGRQLDFYAIKQKNTGLSDTSLKSNEQSYMLNVILGNNITMHDNFRVNLWSGQSGEDGTNVMLPQGGNDSIWYMSTGTNSYRTAGLLAQLDPAAPTASPVPTRLMYQIEVVVQSTSGVSAGKELARLQGTILEKTE